MKTMRLVRAYQGFLISLSLIFAHGGWAQSASGNTIPVVTIQATDPVATWSGNTGTFTVFRTGNPVPALNVYYLISGTASNGVDYQAIGNFIQLPSGVFSNSVVITPFNKGQAATKTVTLQLAPSPLMTPVNFEIGSPSTATVYISPTTNVPPFVTIISPTNGSVFYTPVTISLLARATDIGGVVSNVEFFAGTNDLGAGHPVVLDPPGVSGVVGLVYFLSWANPAPGTYAVTAVAADNQGATATSAPVNISILPGPPPPPPTNLPPVVRITSPANGAVFRGPLDIPIFAFARDPDGWVQSVEFFAGATSLGFGHQVNAVPPPLPPGPVQPPILIVVPTNYWELVWTNVPLGTNLLTAKATDNGGLSTVSSPVNVTILPPPPPPTNRPPIVSILATDPIAIEGTNCWPWLGLANTPATWSGWVAPAAVTRFFTNCGPKNAIFTVRRHGDTNGALTVAYDIGGSATNGIDYVTLPGSITIPAGEPAALITVVPIDDGPPDITSTVILTLNASAAVTPTNNYVLGYPRRAAAVILDRGPLPPTAVLPDKCFHLKAAGPNGAWFHIEYATDLLHWTALCTNQVVNGSIDFVDPDAPGNPARFYRAVPEAGPPAE